MKHHYEVLLVTLISVIVLILRTARNEMPCTKKYIFLVIFQIRCCLYWRTFDTGIMYIAEPYLVTQVIPWSKVISADLIVTQLVKRLTQFPGNRWFITVFRRVRHWPVSPARLIFYCPTHSLFLESVLIAYDLIMLLVSSLKIS